MVIGTHSAPLATGRQYFRQGRSTMAMSAFLAGLDKVLLADDTQEESLYWCELAALLRQAGQVERALALHQHALSVADGSPYQMSVARLGLAADLWGLGDEVASRKMMRLAMKNPNLSACPVLLEKLSQLYTLQQEWLLALDTLEAAIKLYQHDPVSIASCGLALLKLHVHVHVDLNERLLHAVQITTAHMHHLPHIAKQIHIELAQACKRLELHAVAAAHYQSALQIEKPSSLKRPRRLLAVEFKLQQTSSEIEIELLRHTNALQNEQVRQLESTAFRDELTGLHNPRYLQARWPDLLAAAEAGQALCLMNVGIDQATHLREVLGVAVAEQSYVRVAHVLQAALPHGAELITSGNHEFSVVLVGGARAEAERLAKQLKRKMAEIDHSALPENLTLSLGCTLYHAGDTVDVLQLRADLALYLALRQGSGALVWEGEGK